MSHSRRTLSAGTLACNLIRVTIVVHPHALVHGLTAEQIVSAFETQTGSARIRRRDARREPARWAAVGFDSRTRAIEIVFTQDIHGNALVFHANYLTRGFLEEWRRA